jgi:hypothetical protein
MADVAEETDARRFTSLSSCYEYRKRCRRDSSSSRPTNAAAINGSGDGYEGKRFTAVNGSGERVVSVVVVVVVKRKEEEASRRGRKVPSRTLLGGRPLHLRDDR